MFHTIPSQNRELIVYHVLSLYFIFFKFYNINELLYKITRQIPLIQLWNMKYISCTQNKLTKHVDFYLNTSKYLQLRLILPNKHALITDSMHQNIFVQSTDTFRRHFLHYFNLPYRSRLMCSQIFSHLKRSSGLLHMNRSYHDCPHKILHVHVM